jgi:AraC-like DNA-binding protein
MPVSSNFAAVSFSTDDLAEEDRLTKWREHYRQTAFRVEIEPANGQPFQACMTSHSVPGLHLMKGTMSAARVTRSRACLDDGNTDLALVVNRSGHAIVSARGSEVELYEDDAVLMRSDEITVFNRRSRGGSCSLRIPRSILSKVVTDLDTMVMRRIPGETEALRILTGYVGTLMDGNALALPALRQPIATHVYDLVALTLGATTEAIEGAKNRGVRAARLEAAKSYIVENSAHCDLSVGNVASHVGVTTRYLQKLFEDDGSTFSSYLLSQRLARAHRMLSEPDLSERPVGSIAYEVGFGDLSYFNRCFRRRYGTTPLAVREANVEPAIGAA